MKNDTILFNINTNYEFKKKNHLFSSEGYFYIYIITLIRHVLENLEFRNIDKFCNIKGQSIYIFGNKMSVSVEIGILIQEVIGTDKYINAMENIGMVFNKERD